jgi:succinyl-CoA synthetase alpha subunit
MSVLIDQNTHCIIQGMTGKEGQRALEWMRRGGLQVVAGVTPGKGGQDVTGVPVYNTVAEALADFSTVTTSSIYVPPRFVLSAALEALAAGIKLLHIVAEGVPTKDTALLIEKARSTGARILGPSSIGALSPGKAMIGQLGGGEYEAFLPPDPLNSNPLLQTGVAVLSKSGGMANTIAHMLTTEGIPQSSIISIGGDRLIGMTFADVLPDLAADSETRAVVIIGEIGGAYEELLAQAISEQQFAKPVVAFISGLFAETLPQGVAFGHAGAIVSSTTGTRAGKIAALKQAGALVAETLSEITTLLKKSDVSDVS